jgi:hypothetical protein
MTAPKKVQATFSVDVLNYLAAVVSVQSVAGDRADFDEAAALLGKTRRELLGALESASDAPAPNRATRRGKR